ncbi:FkbM family methyltransferase [Clostridium estertheticum]|uniref:FkbM family methyltransferase n=1 Tax=Clostridium estertheticum TaxID=238834 RepID=UPI001C0D0C5B|nr:FkbM family methyltransferase [Clostridium estertheticum]MBU3176437.1 FkbM family methyltransferase [Clostridium estertheticum]
MITVIKLEELLEKFENNTLEVSQNKLGDLKSKQIMLYGAGNIGKKLYRNLKDNEIDIVCFIDRNRDINDSKYNVPIHHPESEQLTKLKEKGYIILSGLFSLNICNEIKEQLFKIGFKNVFALHEVNLSTINSKAFYENLFDGSYNKIDITGKTKSKIIEAFLLLETEKDKELYIEYIRAHLTMDFTRFKEPYDVSMQYLAHDIPLKIDYSRFIDCGGFDGDTIRNFVSKGIQMQNIAVFEPQNDLCKKITEYVSENKEKFNTVTIFPCGVHSKTVKLRFSVSNDAPSSAKVDQNGSDIIQCVAIDEVLHGFNPTFIKMDIEGAEVEALKGARNTIIENHPYLAICVYHSLSDIWEIPLLIKSFYKGYKFYLRSYNFMGFETILYAFPEN